MRALVMDHSRTMRRIVSRVLVGLGYEVVEAADGQQALDARLVAELHVGWPGHLARIAVCRSAAAPHALTPRLTQLTQISAELRGTQQ